MTVHITGQGFRTVGFCYIDANRAASHSFDDFVQFKIFHTEDSQVAIIASQNNPVLPAHMTNPDSDNVIYLMAIKAQDHVWVDVLRLMLKASKNVIETPMRINFFANINAFVNKIQA